MERHKDATSSRFGLDAEGTEVNSLLWTPKAFAIAVFTVKRSVQERRQSALDRRRKGGDQTSGEQSHCVNVAHQAAAPG